MFLTLFMALAAQTHGIQVPPPLESAEIPRGAASDALETPYVP